jgi:putative inorganic carbon (HCO3(-)) transporter
LPLIPVLILVGWIAFTSLDKLVYLVVFFVPFSIPLTTILGKKIEVDLFLPTEPILAGILFLFLLKYLRGQRINKRILLHPISIAIYFNLAWIFITSLTSSMPLVSFKFLIARVWFVVAFYFIAAEIFQSKNKMRQYIWLYLIPFTVVIIYVIVRHSSLGLLNQMASHAVVKPFYNDHTAYGMALGMLIPVLIGLFVSSYRKLTFATRFLFIILILLFITATVLSYTRAAWVSLAGAAGFWLLIRLKIRWQYLAAMALVLIVVFFNFKTQILLKLESNKQTSSGKLTEHLQSISNVQTDESNLERLNRWSCAIRMFEEKPVFGWGPGTYMFQYAPYQNSWEKTSISTNAHNLGNAHSEYLGPLSEQGLFGFISVLFIFGLSIATGLRVYLRSKNTQVRIMAISIMLSLVTYYIHGTLNNFLDTDKASALFWGFTAILVVLDLKYVKPQEVQSRE